MLNEKEIEIEKEIEEREIEVDQEFVVYYGSSDYLSDTLTYSGKNNPPDWNKMVKKLPLKNVVYTTNMSYLFYYLPQIENENIVFNLNTSNVTNMEYTFSGANINRLDLSKWDFSNVTHYSYIFKDCKAEEILVNNTFHSNSNLNEYSYSLFSNCTNLKKFYNVGNMPDTSKYTDIIDLSIINFKPFNSLVSFCTGTKAKKIIMPSDLIDNTCDIGYFFQKNKEVEEIENEYVIFNGKRYRFDGIFQECTKLKKLDLSKANLNPTSSRSMSYTFSNCEELEEIIFPIDNDCSNLTGIENAFYNCYKLKKIDMKGMKNMKWRTVKYGFRNCTSLELIDIRNVTMTATSQIYTLMDNVPKTVKIIVKK